MYSLAVMGPGAVGKSGEIMEVRFVEIRHYLTDSLVILAMTLYYVQNQFVIGTHTLKLHSIISNNPNCE